MEAELIYAELDNGRIRAWIRKATIIIGDRKMPYFYTAFQRPSGMTHSQMMDDFGNLFSADCYALAAE